MTTFSNSDDLIDVRDVIARFEELETQAESEALDADDQTEFDSLKGFLDDLNGMGGDEQWRGDWYPVSLIRDSYFKEYAQELADDIGAIDASASWPCNCIDWDKAARELRMDYSSVEFDGVTYWTR